LLINDNPSPYDSRREYYLSIAYDKMGITDSAIVWWQRASVLKPPSNNMIFFMSSRLFIAGRQQEAVQIMDQFLAGVKTNPEAWLQAADQNVKMGNERKALLLMDSAVKYLPDNNEIVKNWRSLHNLASIKPYEVLYNQATQALSAKRYSETLKLLDDFISKKPDYTEAYQNRAYCLCFLGEYSKSLLDIEIALSKGDGNEAFLINIRGANYIGLGRTDEACLDFKQAMDKGSAEGATNYRKFCGS
jgi:tetratricopeptide (TPR) repeat protein